MGTGVGTVVGAGVGAAVGEGVSESVRVVTMGVAAVTIDGVKVGDGEGDRVTNREQDKNQHYKN